MEILCLGAGNAFAPPGLGWSGFVVDGAILLDAPPDLLSRLNTLGVTTAEVDTVLVSHFHADHFAGLPSLMLHMALRDGRTAPLLIVGPPGVESRVEDLSLAMGIRKRDRGSNFDRRYLEVRGGDTLALTGTGVTVFEMKHAPSLTALGYRVSRAGRSVAYAGDTTLCPALIDLCRGTDLAIVESSSATEENRTHMNLRMLRELRAGLGPNPRVLVTHRGADVAIEDLPNTSLAVPGERYTA